ncbi:uncharacterized protein LOC133876730 [Alnus glutinosa]|uniref:uncharacterized protein LOC133876730 n=1 Tax=Alnus glutinosa TaxID=3517 RepID=UPI002D7650FA|nr:uncharacterized protein LOC133876730 [Alnus glutinosa]
MESLGYSSQSLSILFLFFPIWASATQLNIPRLGTVIRRTSQHDEPQTTYSSSDTAEDFKTFYYTQQLDHFNYRPESYATFQQRYVINFKYWGGADSNAPIFAYLGAEESLDHDLSTVGFLNDNALRFKALQLFIEHRYYGKSVPFGSMKEALKNASTRGYFNSAQAIADYAAVLLHVKKNLSAEYSPIIAIGGSYGGMLAAWFRLKYPHIVLGSLASSAPILYFDGISPEVGYYSIVTKDFKETSQSCFETIQKSWTEIDRIASRPDGLSTLSKRFNTCGQLNISSDLKDYLESIITEAAQYNAPPKYPVSVICSAIDGTTVGTDTLGQIYAAVVAYKGNRSCHNMNEYNYPTETNEGWKWQDIKLILQRFASNIIFSNGLKDPYSSGGVLEDISDSIVAVSTINGSHCLDIHKAKESDPKWLVKQRQTEVEIIEKWIAKYQADLLAFKQHIPI